MVENDVFDYLIMIFTTMLLGILVWLCIMRSYHLDSMDYQFRSHNQDKDKYQREQCTSRPDWSGGRAPHSTEEEQGEAD